MTTDVCEECGRLLTSDESLDRHRGMKYHIAWLEKRVAELELQVTIARAAVGSLLNCNQKRTVKEVIWKRS